MYNEKNQNSRLPPIQHKPNIQRPRRSANSQRRTEVPKPHPQQNITKDIDSRVESSLVQMLEKQVTELSTQLDKAEIDRSRMEFEFNIMKRDHDKVVFESEQLKQEIEELTEKSHELEERNR